MRWIFLWFLLAPPAAAQVFTDAVYHTGYVIQTISASVATTSVVVLPANRWRNGLTIYNNSANSVYLTFGPISSGSTCTRILATFAQWDMLGPVIYTGQISAIRNAGSGTLVITEYQ